MSSPQVLFVSGKHPIREVGGFGHSIYVRAHARAATLAGYEPHIFCAGESDAIEPEPFGIVHQLASTHPARQSELNALGPPFARALIDAAMARAAGEPVLIHAFGAWSYAGALALEHLRRRGRRAVMVVSSYTTHVDESRAMLAGAVAGDDRSNRWRFLREYLWSLTVVDGYERRGYRAAHVVAVNYDAVGRAIRRRHGAGVRIERARYSSDDAFLRRAATVAPVGDDDPPRIVCVSGHFERKGTDVLLRACALLRERGVRFRADLVGGGALLASDRALAERLRLGDCVDILGIVPDVHPYLARADVYTLPSRSEQSGSLALIEALEAGLPVVASACDGIPEDLDGSEAGILVAPGDPVELAGALERLLADPAERERRSAAARARFSERFSPDAFASDIGRIYAEALASV